MSFQEHLVLSPLQGTVREQFVSRIDLVKVFRDNHALINNVIANLEINVHDIDSLSAFNVYYLDCRDLAQGILVFQVPFWL